MLTDSQSPVCKKQVFTSALVSTDEEQKSDDAADRPSSNSPSKMEGSATLRELYAKDDDENEMSYFKKSCKRSSRKKTLSNRP